MDPTYFARDVQTLERLLRENHSATVGYTGRFGQSRAVEALALNLLDVAKYVVKNQGVSFNIEDPLVDAALEHAIATNNMEALHLIVTHSSLRPTCLTQDTISQFTVESVEDSFPINRRLSRGNTALHYAVMYESVHATDYLLAQGANPAFVWPELPKKRWAHGIMTLPRAQSYPSKAPSPFQITNSTNEPLVLQYRASNEFHYVQVIAAREVVSLRFAPGTVLQLLHQVTGQVVAYLDSGAYDIVDVIGPGHVVDDTFGRTAADTIAAWSPLQSVMTAVYPPESPMAAIQARLQLKDRMLALLKAPQLFDMRFVVDMVPLVTSVEDLAYFVGIVVAYDTLWSDQAGDDMLSRLLRHVMDKKLVLQSEQAAFFSVYILDRLKNLGRLNEFQVAFWKSEATKVGGESAGWVAELRQRQQVVALNLHHLNDQIGTVAAVVSRMGQTLANLLQREQVRAIRGEFKHKCNVIVGLATCHFGFVGKIAKEGIVRALMYIFKQFVTLPMLPTIFTPVAGIAPPPMPSFSPSTSRYAPSQQHTPPAYVSRHDPALPTHHPHHTSQTQRHFTYVNGRRSSMPPESLLPSQFVELPPDRHRAVSVTVQGAQGNYAIDHCHSAPPSSSSQRHDPDARGRMVRNPMPDPSAAENPPYATAPPDDPFQPLDAKLETFVQLLDSMESGNTPVTDASMNALATMITGVPELNTFVGHCMLHSNSDTDLWIRHAIDVVTTKGLLVTDADRNECKLLLCTCIESNLVQATMAPTLFQWIHDRRPGQWRAC